jgi:hypothetical protein
MSDHPEDESNPNEPEAVRNLREANRRKDDEIKTLRAQAKRGAFAEAGIKLEGAGQLLFDTYDGELDADAIKAAAERYGLTAPPPPAAEPEVENPGDQQQLSEQDAIRGSLSAEALAPGSGPEFDPDGMTKAFERRNERLANGEKREWADAEVFGEILKGAAAGDPRYLMANPQDNPQFR